MTDLELSVAAQLWHPTTEFTHRRSYTEFSDANSVQVMKTCLNSEEETGRGMACSYIRRSNNEISKGDCKAMGEQNERTIWSCTWVGPAWKKTHTGDWDPLTLQQLCPWYLTQKWQNTPAGTLQLHRIMLKVGYKAITYKVGQSGVQYSTTLIFLQWTCTTQLFSLLSTILSVYSRCTRRIYFIFRVFLYSPLIIIIISSLLTALSSRSPPSLILWSIITTSFPSSSRPRSPRPRWRPPLSGPWRVFRRWCCCGSGKRSETLRRWATACPRLCRVRSWRWEMGEAGRRRWRAGRGKKRLTSCIKYTLFLLVTVTCV